MSSWFNWGVLLTRKPATGFELLYTFRSMRYGEEEETCPCYADHALRLFFHNKGDTARHLTDETWAIDAGGLDATMTLLRDIGVTPPTTFSCRVAIFQALHFKKQEKELEKKVAAVRDIIMNPPGVARALQTAINRERRQLGLREPPRQIRQVLKRIR